MWVYWRQRAYIRHHRKGHLSPLGKFSAHFSRIYPLIVLDANILIHAVLGTRVREMIQAHAAPVKFFATDLSCTDARKSPAALLRKRGVDSVPAMLVLDAIKRIVHPMDMDGYGGAAVIGIAAYRDAELRRLAGVGVRDGAWLPGLNWGCRLLRCE